jgi:DNA helicase-2/ATP-dependent DNA helicase PcrA
LKVYKLERLLDVLNLEGVNSHNAIDDVNATVGLMEECYRRALKMREKQNLFMEQPMIAGISKMLKERYAILYRQGLDRLYNQEDEGAKSSLLVQEMIHAHDFFTQQKLVSKVDKWTYIADYYDTDIVDKNKYPSLIEQLNAFITEVNTAKESDMCGSKSMKAQFFISTVYKSKGLEFNSVIVPSVVRDVYPLFSRYDEYGDIKDKVGEKEDARLLYVALSRAKKRLCVIWYKNKNIFSKNKISNNKKCHSFQKFYTFSIK